MTVNSNNSKTLPESEIMENVHRFFATEVALITTNGSKYGPNVMAVEWTMQIAYDPILIAIFIHDSPLAELEMKGLNASVDFFFRVFKRRHILFISDRCLYVKIFSILILLKRRTAAIMLKRRTAAIMDFTESEDNSDFSRIRFTYSTN